MTIYRKLCFALQGTKTVVVVSAQEKMTVKDRKPLDQFQSQKSQPILAYHQGFSSVDSPSYRITFTPRAWY